MKTRIFIILIISLILPGLALAQETSIANVSDSKTDEDRPNIEKEKITDGQISYTVYLVHDLDSLVNARKMINLNLAKEDRPLAHGKLLAFNPRILEQISGGLMTEGKISVTYYKKPCILFVVLNQRFKLGQLGAAVINIKKKTKSVTVFWTGEEMKVELKLYKGELI